jgi:predicted nucleotidyltransferase
MFTAEERDRVRARMLELARSDGRVTGGAVTGSAARAAEDRWSDVDLFFGVADEIEIEELLADWTSVLYRDFDAIHHFDLRSGSAIYRAFLLPSCLELDIGLTPAAEFGPLGPNFRAVFGDTVERAHAPPPSADHLTGLGWHHVLHARVCIERRKPWQAEYWISAIRDHAQALACLRLDEPAVFARGVDRLPPEVTAPLEGALVRSLAPGELERALRVAADALLRELRAARPELAARLEAPIRELTDG